MLVNDKPKYKQIADLLSEQIKEGELKAGDRLPSFTEMYREHGATATTMRRVYELLEKGNLIERRGGSGVYVADVKRSLTGNIGLLLNQDSQYDPYTRNLIAGIQAQAREYGLNILLVDGQETISDEKLDGLLMFCSELEVSLIKMPPYMPRVLLLTPATKLNITNVVTDDFGGAKMATEYLLSLGHRRISCMLSTNRDAYSALRLAGYSTALSNAGIAFDEKLVRYVVTTPADLEAGPVNYIETAEECMRQWLQEGWRDLDSTAMLAPNDLRAFGIMKVFAHEGISVPRDISVVGFDGIENTGNKQSLTTVQVPLRQIGERGVKLLWEHIQNRTMQPEKITLPGQLKLGESTSPI